MGGERIVGSSTLWRPCVRSPARVPGLVQPGRASGPLWLRLLRPTPRRSLASSALGVALGAHRDVFTECHRPAPRRPGRQAGGEDRSPSSSWWRPRRPRCRATETIPSFAPEPRGAQPVQLEVDRADVRFAAASQSHVKPSLAVMAGDLRNPPTRRTSARCTASGSPPPLFQPSHGRTSRNWKTWPSCSTPRLVVPGAVHGCRRRGETMLMAKLLREQPTSAPERALR